MTDGPPGSDAAAVPPEVVEGPGTEPATPPTDSSPNRRLLKDNMGVAAGTALSRVTGVLRLLALYYAAGPALRDAYILANNTPNIIYELILGGILTATLVPLFTQHVEQDDPEATASVVSVALLALAGLTVLTFVAAPLLILLYSTNPGKGVDVGSLRHVGIVLSLLFAPQVFFYGTMALGTALLNARHRFLAAAWAPVLNNVVVIAVLVLVGALDLGGDARLPVVADDTSLLLVLGLGTTAGIVAMALALIPPLRRAGVHLTFRPNWHHPAVRTALTLSGWTVGYVIANQIAAQTVNVLAKPGSGDVSNYNVAFMFFQLPHGLLAVSLMTTFQPDLARAAVRGDDERFNQRLLLGLRLLALAVVPAAVGYFALTLTAGRAANGISDLGDSTSLLGSTRILAGFALGLIGFSGYLFVLRAFYAMQDTRTPFLLNLVENALNITFAVILVRPFGVVGLGVAYALAYTVAAALALRALRRRKPDFPVGALLASVAKMLGAAAAMGAVVAGLVTVAPTDSVPALVAVTAVAVALGAAVYAAGVTLLRVPAALGLSRGRFAR